MTRDEKLEALAQVLLTAAGKAKELAGAVATGGALRREAALALQIEGIVHELLALTADRKEGGAE